MLEAYLSNEIVLPRRGRGRPTVEAEAKYRAEVESFCASLKEIASRLDFNMSARGWGYYLEGLRAIDKGDIHLAESRINEFRKSGDLPLDICSDDDACEFANVVYIDKKTPEQEADFLIKHIRQAHRNYNPISFWDNQRYYVQMAVEKVDLKSLFEPVCEDYHVPIANSIGWARIGMRADMMRRFQHWEERGKECVLLFCGDFDPGGLQISKFWRDNLAELSGAVGWSPDKLIIDRFGLNEDYIAEHSLVWIDNLITGSGVDLSSPKHPQHKFGYVQDYIARYGVRKVEANALLADPEAGRELCREAIKKYIDSDAEDEFWEELDRRQKEVLRLVEARLKAA